MKWLRVGVLELFWPVGVMTPRQREQVADVLSGIAADILKGTPDRATRMFSIQISEKETA